MCDISKFEQLGLKEQFSSLSQIVELISDKYPPSISELFDEELCIALQWLDKTNLTCIIDSKGDYQLVHSVISEGPFSLKYKSTESEKVKSLLIVFFDQGPKIFHQCFYEQKLHDVINVLTDMRISFSLLVSSLKIVKNRLESENWKNVNPLTKVAIIIGTLLSNENRSQILKLEKSLKSISDLPAIPLNLHLHNASNELWQLIESQRHVIRLTSTDTLEQLQNLFVSAEAILKSSNQDDIFTITQTLTELSPEQLSQVILKVELLSVSVCFQAANKCFKLIDDFLNEILNFGFTNAKKVKDSTNCSIN